MSHGEGAKSMSHTHEPTPQTQYLTQRWLSCREQLHRPTLDLKERNTTLVIDRTRCAGQGPSAPTLTLPTNGVC